MEFDVERGMEVLARTPAVLQALLGDLGEYWTHGTYGKDTFSPFDVVGHLIHGDHTDWIPRTRIILEQGEKQAFEPFDRFAQYDFSRGKNMAELLDEFAAVRGANVAALRGMNLGPEQLALRGAHPEFGSITLGAMLATWVVHDLNHIAQVMRAMSYQYRDEVGPWKQYLSVLKP